MVQHMPGRVVHEATRIKELEAQVKKLEDITRELLDVVDVADVQRRKVRHTFLDAYARSYKSHAFLDAYARSYKHHHPEEGLEAGPDCLADANLYSRGERTDEWVFHAVYGLPSSTVSRGGKSTLHFHSGVGMNRWLTQMRHN
jgi:hypothetical protein